MFLSPPWGGPEYLNADVFDLDALQPASASALLGLAKQSADAVAFFLPRNTEVSGNSSGFIVKCEQSCINYCL